MENEDIELAELLVKESKEARTWEIIGILLDLNANGKTIDDAICAIKAILKQ